MGQCMSRKAAGAFAVSAATAQSRPSKMQKNNLNGRSPDDNNKDSNIRKPNSNNTKGISTSFGFRPRRPTTAPVASNASAARRLANGNSEIIDRNGNETDNQSCIPNQPATGRSTQRLAPPKKELNATRVSRFGYRDKVNRLNKVADLNQKTCAFAAKTPPKSAIPSPNSESCANSNENNRNRLNRPTTGIPQMQASKFTLQSTHLPRPQPIRFIDTRSKKAVENINKNRKIACTMPDNLHKEIVPKDGSLTEDSGVGSHVSGCLRDNGNEPLDHSPTFGVRRIPARKLDVVNTGTHVFDVRDLADSTDSVASLPQLPGPFNVSPEKYTYLPIGLVHERTIEYQRHVDENRRHVWSTSSDLLSAKIKKSFSISESRKSPFDNIDPCLKIPTKEIQHAASPPSSDEQEWTFGGEAMADKMSCSLSSCDEFFTPISRPDLSTTNPLLSIGQSSVDEFYTPPSRTESHASMGSLLSTPISDTNVFGKMKFSVLAARATGAFIEDETMASPMDHLISFESEEDFTKIAKSESNSKDVNEKLTPTNSGTTTNTSNSLSLSDEKEDFLIDDEIADQPALVFEKTLVNDLSFVNVSQKSDHTVVDSTAKPKRKILQAFDGSPLSINNRKMLGSRAGSLDTLSPCDSIASDDMMMDFDDCVDDCDRPNMQFITAIENTKRNFEVGPAGCRDWSNLLGTYVKGASRSRVLRSRAGTPNSVPDAPRSLDSSRVASNLVRSSASGSPSKAKLRYSEPPSIPDDYCLLKQDVVDLKTGLIKLKISLNESNTHNPFENQASLTNGLFGSPRHLTENAQVEDVYATNDELVELKRQVLFLQGELDDKNKTVQTLQEQVVKLHTQYSQSNSAPASTMVIENECNSRNAATQTDRIRPISAGPSLLNGSSVDGNAGSLVSANESLNSRKSRPPISDTSSSKRTPSRLWRKPGEPPSPQRYTSSPTSLSISSTSQRRANSRSRTPFTPP